MRYAILFMLLLQTNRWKVALLTKFVIRSKMQHKVIQSIVSNVL